MEKEIIVKQIIYACEMPVSYETKKVMITECLEAYEKDLPEKTKIVIKSLSDKQIMERLGIKEDKNICKAYNRVKPRKKGYKQHQTPQVIANRKKLIRLASKYSHLGYTWADSLRKAHKKVYHKW